ncbi:hypothetical protein TNCV_348531 [Trichonephila clavipes]|nr:hypothetical protein TNCV_348531 [Trichonephila clavipes]
MSPTFSIGDMSGEYIGQGKIQSDWKRRTLEHCVPRVVAHYPVGIWLMTSAEYMGGPWALTPQRCSAGCSVYRHCVREIVWL